MPALQWRPRCPAPRKPPRRRPRRTPARPPSSASATSRTSPTRRRSWASSKGIFAEELGETKLSTQVFNAGPAAIEALYAGAIDATYIGPNPAINAFVKCNGQSVSIIAGAATGGAQLVVKPGINSAADLKGKTLATPQLGNTQDVALRSWLGEQGFKTTTDGGGDVAINPTENAQTLKLFQEGELDGAWLPEPWASRLVLEAGAKVLVDEKDLWDEGRVRDDRADRRKEFLAEHPETVQALLKGHVESVDWLDGSPPPRRPPCSTRHSRQPPASRCRPRSSTGPSST